MSLVRYLVKDRDTGYIPRGDQLYLAITRGPSAARAESDGQVQLVTEGYILTRVARVKMYKKALWSLFEGPAQRGLRVMAKYSWSVRGIY